MRSGNVAAMGSSWSRFEQGCELGDTGLLAPPDLTQSRTLALRLVLNLYSATGPVGSGLGP